MYKNLLLYTYIVIIVFCCTLFTSCKQDATPKPKAFLSLDYPEQEYAEYKNFKNYYAFEKNKIAEIKNVKDNSIEIHYPSMKATIFVNYKKVDNNLDKLLQDAQKLTYEHFIKADEIIEQPYLNPEDKVYGMFYNVQGDAATNVQFYVTDSVKNFLVASLYFYAKPNFDSILPAKDYIQKDMQHIIETLQWNRLEHLNFTTVD